MARAFCAFFVDLRKKQGLPMPGKEVKMPIKWSATKVSEAMDEVEAQVLLGNQFIAEAKAKAQEAKKIANLPQYVEQRVNRLIDQLDRLESIKDAIESVRKDIPDGAMETEQESSKHGSTQSLM